VLFEIDYKLIAKMTERLLEGVCRQVSAERFQRLRLLADRLAVGAGAPVELLQTKKVGIKSQSP
jgi:hypothetical protein